MVWCLCASLCKLCGLCWVVHMHVHVDVTLRGSKTSRSKRSNGQGGPDRLGGHICFTIDTTALPVMGLEPMTTGLKGQRSNPTELYRLLHIKHTKAPCIKHAKAPYIKHVKARRNKKEQGRRGKNLWWDLNPRQPA